MNEAFPLYSRLSSTDGEQRATLGIERSFAEASIVEFSDVCIDDNSLNFRYEGVELCLSWECEVYDGLIPLILSATPFMPPVLLSATKLVAEVHGLSYALVFNRFLQGFTCMTQPSGVDDEQLLRELVNEPFELLEISTAQFKSVIERCLAARDLSPKDLNSSLAGVTRAAFAAQTLWQLEELETIRIIHFVTCPNLRYFNGIRVKHQSHTTVLEFSGVPRLSI